MLHDFCIARHCEDSCLSGERHLVYLTDTVLAHLEAPRSYRSKTRHSHEPNGLQLFAPNLSLTLKVPFRRLSRELRLPLGSPLVRPSPIQLRCNIEAQEARVKCVS